MMKQNLRRRGLILLVVLSMLTLFSLLAISYVVFSGQSRSANFGMARVDFHGMKPAEVIDEAMKQVLRGTADNISAVGPHALLADVYGYGESSSSNLTNLLYQVRSAGTGLAEVFAGRFLRIPLDASFMPYGSGATSNLPPDDDALTGRVLTFKEGPLAGISFRIVRSLGNVSGTHSDQSFSVIIDLDEAGDQAASITATTAAQLCVGPTRGHQLWINARELNASGYGIPHNFDGETVLATPTSGVGNIPLSLQPGLQPILQPGSVLDGQVGRANSRSLTGDSDEAYDAPDANDFWLAHTRLPLVVPDPSDAGASGLPGENIIPSFHRAALINYIVNREDLTSTSTFTQDDFLSMLTDIQGACGRPLGISVVGLENRGPYFSANPYFDGSNPGSNVSTPVLNINLGGSWNNWSSGSPSPYALFLNWVRMLTGGPWDIDNDGDGINDSVWVDLDLPLITSSEGKLLKLMAAYYIEDLDNRLDLNAVGNLTQETTATYLANTGSNPNYTLTGTDLPQGVGLGPADSSLRHFFGTDADYKLFLNARYGGVDNMPGTGTLSSPVDDLRSKLNGGSDVYFPAPFNANQNVGTRSRRRIVRHDQLPGLPAAVRGGIAMGFDRLGNPLMLRGTSLFDQGTEDPYEARWMSTTHHDAPFEIAEWERIYRFRDWDRSTFPRRLEGFTPIVDAIGSVTPRSSHTRHVPLAATTPTGGPVTSFLELLQSIGQFRRPTQVTINSGAYAQLFPLEFKRGLAMDLNRPFGNGIDDDLDGSIDEPDEMLKNGLDDDGDSAIDEPDELTLFNGAGTDLNLGQRQQAVYVFGSEAQRTGISELPAFDTTNFQYAGYTAGNIDPDYERIVVDGIGGNNASRTIANLHHGQQSRQLMARHLYCLAMLLLPDELYLSNLPSGMPLTGAERARALAQWAVNIVDFRDADHAMTRFAYDPNPFVDKGSGVYWLPNRDGSGNATGDVVWGMEQPELLLTETAATHDLRVKDTNVDNGANPATVDAASNPDDDYDQYRLPEGSLFLELFCPRTTSTVADANVPGTAGSLYTVSGTDRVLNLGAVSPSDGTTGYPVWRVAISAPHAYTPGDVTAPTAGNVVKGTAEVSGTQVLQHDVSYQLATDTSEILLNGLAYDRPSGGRGPMPTPVIDRLLWFTNSSNISDVATAAVGLPSTVMAADRPAHVYFNQAAANPLLNGGQYLVVGPRQTTYFGSKTSSGSSHLNEPNNHRIVIEGPTVTSTSIPAPATSWANFYTTDNSLVARRPAMRDIVSMIAVTTPPWDGSSTPNLPPDIGLNVSEPHPTLTGYYPEPTHELNSTDTTGDATNGADGFADIPKDAYYDYGSPVSGHPDTPFDHQTGTPIKEFYEPHHPETDTVMGVASPGTQFDWCTAYLQRLADPERPYHATFNPYITVDWMPIDLTVFSGEDLVYTDPTKMDEFTATDANYRFGFRSKNGALGTDRGRTFLSYLSDEPVNNPTAATGVYFDRDLTVDNADGALTTLPQVQRPTTANTNFATLGYLNSPYALLNDFNDPPTAPVNLLGAQTFVGVPATPPASLLWFNRDFASPYELMFVPLSSPGQLMQEFSAPLDAAAIAADNAYLDYRKENIFRHLPNFFQEAADPNTPMTGLRQAFTPAALLELVTTPSPWSDADKVVSPNSFNLVDPRELFALGPLLPPYNRVPQMREPGRVNINTVENINVWQGIEWNYLSTAGRTASNNSLAFNDLKVSRHRYIQPPGSEQVTGVKRNSHLDGNYPTEFPGVFKSVLAAGRVPPTRAGVLDQPATVTPAMATLFRQSPSTTRPLFSPRPDLIASSVPNPYTEYLPFARLPNLVTTRSNVFAVRITVGYFEFDPSTGIGPEYGWDSGQARRHRGFYVIDRSIPVAFEPGQDLNTGNCVLVRRIVE